MSEAPQPSGGDRSRDESNPNGDHGGRAPGDASGQPAPAWHSFGVPHGGAPEPPVYTPAMRERSAAGHGPLPESGNGGAPTSGDQTQPIAPQPALWSGSPRPGPQPAAAGAPIEHPQAPWWSTPGSAQQERPAYEPLPQPPAYPPPTGPAYPPPLGPAQPAGGPATSALPAVDAPRRKRGWAALAVVAVLAALLGGGVALAGQQLLSRGTSLGSAVPPPGPGSTARPEGSIAKIAADALPSVVTLRIKTSDGSGTGSGFVIDKQGHVLTNNHVVAAAGSSGQITVELNNGTTLPATVAGADASYDLAVVKIDTTDIPPLEFGASKDVVVGDGVIAVGAPLGLDATVTSGIVSALNRPVTPGDGNDQSFINAIQTDAAINPGNSGGPLLDMSGRVIGVNSAIARIPGSTSSSGGNIGVGFAIPSDQAKKTAQQLITTGKAEHPALGVRVDPNFDGDGAKLASGAVQSGSAAEQAGLKDGDVILQFEGKKVTDADALIVAIRSRSVGDTVHLKVQRGNQTLDVSMTLQSGTS